MIDRYESASEDGGCERQLSAIEASERTLTPAVGPGAANISVRAGRAMAGRRPLPTLPQRATGQGAKEGTGHLVRLALDLGARPVGAQK